jgi:tRNA(Ile)-lysidine synthase
MEKEEILLLCEKNGIAFVTDKTNTDTDYTRNLIRAKLVPVLKEINPATVRNVARMCEGLREDARCLAHKADRFLAEHSHGNAIEASALRDAPPAIGNRALISLFARVSEGYSAEYTHIMALRQLAEEAVPHSSVSLPGRMEGVIEDRCLVLRAQEEKTEISDYELVLCDGSNTISQTNAQIIIGNSQKTINVYKKSIRLYLDSATINGALVARRRRAGDRIRQGGMSKSLKKLLCEKKIPPQLRDRIPVLCDGSGIVAVPWVALRDGAEYRGSNRANALCIEICL